jgi:predicted permease
MRALRLWWRALTRRRDFEAELAAELEFHQQARTDELVARGMAPDAARRTARIELGARESHADACREARGLQWVDRVAQDLRYAVRGLRRNPGYSLTALAVLSLAIAANALLFALFNAYALRSPPIERVERWVAVDSRSQQGRLLDDDWAVPDADALLRDPPPQFEGLYAFRGLRLPVEADVNRQAGGEAVSDNYFDLLGVRPAFGRGFRAGQAGDGAPDVVLSDLGWQRLAGADPGVLGRSIKIAGRHFDVIGVAPPGFTGLTVNSALFWIREADYRALPGLANRYRWAPDVAVGGFLREGASAEAAAAALTPLALVHNAEKDETLRVASVRVMPRRGYLSPAERHELILVAIPVACAFALLLLVAASNLANLVLARFAARQRELAVRVAVGAPRHRLLAQLMSECVLLAIAAALLGYAFAVATLAPVHAALFSHMAELGYDMIEVRIDLRVFAYGLALALLAVLSFGGLPAWAVTSFGTGRAQQPDMASLQRAGSSRLRSVLMVVQIASSVTLLVLASLAAGNARQAEQVALGYDPTRLASLNVNPPTEALAATLRALPGVEGVSATSHMPLMEFGQSLDTRVGDRSQPLRARRVDATYFDTLELEVLQGRALRRADERSANVVVISRRTAERLWPGGSALGQSISVPVQEANELVAAGRYEVVGVVEDVVHGWYVAGPDASALYFPGELGDPALGDLMVRTRDATPAVREAIRLACARALPTDSCELLPLGTIFSFQRLPFVITSTVGGALGWTALVISCLGLYGLVSYLVLQKRREIGVRLALGASSARVARQILGQAGRQIALGIALGLPLAFAAAQLARSASEHIQAFDALSFGLVPLVLGLLALASAWVPARRTAGVAPTEALREE